MNQLATSLNLLRAFVALLFPFTPISSHWILVAFALTTKVIGEFTTRVLRVPNPSGFIIKPVADKIFLIAATLTWLNWKTISWQHALMLTTHEIIFILIIFGFALRGQLRSLRPVSIHPLGRLVTLLQYVCFLTIVSTGVAIPTLFFITAVMGFISGTQYLSLIVEHRESLD